MDCLIAAGVHRVVVGHTPHGNCPTVIKQVYEATPSYELSANSEDAGEISSRAASPTKSLKLLRCFEVRPRPSTPTNFEA